MTTEIQNHPGATQPNSQEHTSAIINHLNACLTMVRPAWMSDESAAEWLAIAATDLRHLDLKTLAQAAREARGKCTHHGQIVPAILESKAVAEERSFKALKRGLGWDGPPAPRLTGKSEVQQLIQATANDLTAR